jgi:hypothetical protein
MVTMCHSVTEWCGQLVKDVDYSTNGKITDRPKPRLFAVIHGHQDAVEPGWH